MVPTPDCHLTTGHQIPSDQEEESSDHAFHGDNSIIRAWVLKEHNCVDTVTPIPAELFWSRVAPGLAWVALALRGEAKVASDRASVTAWEET